MRLIHLAAFAEECKVSPQSVRKAADRYSFSITKGMVDADCQGATAYRTHVTTQRHVAWHDKSTRKQKLEAKAAARTADAPSSPLSVVSAGLVSPSAEQHDDDPKENLTHLEAIVLVNDVAALLASSVECDVMHIDAYPGQKTPFVDPDQLAYVKRIVKAVRSERTNAKAEKKVIDILRAVTKKTLADMKDLNVFFRHYCMELEDRFSFACDFEPNEWDAIETLSDDPTPASPDVAAEDEAPGVGAVDMLADSEEEES
jgi:hypothetical protein